jgi:hypothetical protein
MGVDENEIGEALLQLFKPDAETDRFDVGIDVVEERGEPSLLP